MKWCALIMSLTLLLACSGANDGGNDLAPTEPGPTTSMGDEETIIPISEVVDSGHLIITDNSEDNIERQDYNSYFSLYLHGTTQSTITFKKENIVILALLDAPNSVRATVNLFSEDDTDELWKWFNNLHSDGISPTLLYQQATRSPQMTFRLFRRALQEQNLAQMATNMMFSKSNSS